MHRKLKGLILMLALAALVLAGYGAYRGLAPAKGAAPPPTEAVRRGDITITVSASGTITYPREAKLTFPVSGTVLEVNVEEGQEVKAGEILMKLEDPDFRRAVLQAEVNLKNAQIALKDAQEPYEEEDLLQARLNRQNAQESLALAEADLTIAPVSAEISLIAARESLEQSQDNYQEKVRLYYGLSLSQEELLKPPFQVLQGPPQAPPQDWVDLLNSVANTRTALEDARDEAANALANTQAAVEQARLRLQEAEAGVSLVSAQNALREAEDNYRTLVHQRLRVSLSPGELYARPIEVAPDYAEPSGYVLTSLQRGYEDMLLARDKLESSRVAREEAVAAARSSLEKAQQSLELARSPLTVTKAEQALEKAQTSLRALEAPIDPQEVERWGMGGALARKRISDAYQSLDEARQKLAQAQLQATRSIAAAQGAVARAKLSLALAQVRLKEVEEGADLDQVELKKGQLSLAESSLQQALLDLKGTVLVAPFNGVVAEVRAEAGGRVGGGAAIVVLVDPSRVEVEATVDEIDVARVAVDQTAMITLEALPGRPLPGRVKAIFPVAQVQAGVVTYKVVLEVGMGAAGGGAPPGHEGSPRSGASPRPRAPSPPQGTIALRGGMTALAEIVVESKTDVLLVPSRAVRQVRGRATVTVVGEGGAREEREVTLGSNDGRSTEITSGLQEGEKVVLPAASPTPTPRAPGFAPGFGGRGGFIR